MATPKLNILRRRTTQYGWALFASFALVFLAVAGPPSVPWWLWLWLAAGAASLALIAYLRVCAALPNKYRHRGRRDAP